MNLLDKKCGRWAALVLRCHAAHLLPALALPAVCAAGAALATVLCTAPAFAQGTAVLTGTIVDTATKRPIPDVVVTVTSPALQGEQTVVTDKSGSYRIPSLPPGTYSLRLEGDAYKPYSRGGINLRVDSTIRVNAELLPEGIKAEEVVVVGKAPTVDVGSSSTGVTLNQEFVSRVALNPPGGKGAAARSFESLATVAPGAVVDQYGVSIAGTTSPENAFLIDGVSVSDPAYGLLGTPMTTEFIKEVSVITGGYLPEYGKAMGGIVDVVTKTGSNEFHGQVYFNISPGALEGHRTPITSAAYSVITRPSLGSLRDFGADIGGPIIKDKLWFYAGLQFSFLTDQLERNLYQFNYRPDAAHAGGFVRALDKTGFPTSTPVTCSRADADAGICSTSKIPASPMFQATQSGIQYIGKLTYLINQDHHLTLSVYGTPTKSGGNGSYGLDATGQPLGANPAHPGQLWGAYNALANQYTSESFDTSLKYSAAFNNKRQLFDLTLGWHHQHNATSAPDGSGPGQTLDPSVLAGVPMAVYRQSKPAVHSLTDFESLPRGTATGACAYTPVWSDTQKDPMTGKKGTFVNTPTCAMPTYSAGGPGFIDDVLSDSYQAKAVFTDLLQAAGHHVIKAGVDFSFNSYKHDKAYSGTDVYRDTSSGKKTASGPSPGAGAGAIYDFRGYGFSSGPDQVTILPHYVAHTTTTSVGGFLQDSWAIFDKVTLNVGVRYDAQIIYGADGTLGLTLPNQWSPRVGVIYDFTQQGRSKLFANYARYYEGVPLDIADRSFPNEPQVQSFHDPKKCNPLDPTNVKKGGGCTTDAGRQQQGSTNNPSQIWSRIGGGRESIDPNISPQSSDEFVVGGEYEIFPDARLSVTYTHRYLVKAIEDMSRDEANTYFLGNPGYGIAKDFPKSTRTYDGLTFALTKAYANTWLLSASYTLSRLYGNYAGLFRPETGQLDPNINSTFDLKSLLANQTGPLPGDHTHSIKIYSAKDFLLPAGQDILLGLTYRTLSGSPVNAYGAHVLYGFDEAFVIPRGTGGKLNPDGSITSQRTDWVHNIDFKLGYSARLTKESTLALTVDVFNLFGFQAATLVDQRYTASDVLPCQTGTVPGCVIHPKTGGKLDPATEINPNYGRPIVYQDPRQWRFGAKVTF